MGHVCIASCLPRGSRRPWVPGSISELNPRVAGHVSAQPNGPTHGLVPFSILRGMPDMNCSLMQKLARDCVSVKRMPETEKPLFSCIIHRETFFPDMSDAEVNEFFFGLRQHAVRQTLKALDESSLTENFEHADGVMDAKDADAIKEVVKRSRAKLEEQLAVRYVQYAS